MAGRIARAGLLTTLAICVAWLERLLPLQSPVPGVKLGLANVVTLVALYVMGAGSAFLVTVLRVALTGFMFGGVSGIIYGMAGGLSAYAVMCGLKKTRRPTAAGVSVAGGVAHNTAQITVAALVVENTGLFYYLPVLILSGAAAGLLTGICALYVIKHIKMLSTRGA